MYSASRIRPALFVYATAYDQSAIVRHKPDGLYEIVVHNPRKLWPDTISVTGEGYLNFIAINCTGKPITTKAATCA